MKNVQALNWQSGTVITHSPPTSEVGGSNPGTTVGKLVVAYQLSSVRTLTNCILVCSAHKTTRRDMTCTVLKAM